MYEINYCSYDMPQGKKMTKSDKVYAFKNYADFVDCEYKEEFLTLAIERAQSHCYKAQYDTLDPETGIVDCYEYAVVTKNGSVVAFFSDFDNVLEYGE